MQEFGDANHRIPDTVGGMNVLLNLLCGTLRVFVQKCGELVFLDDGQG